MTAEQIAEALGGRRSGAGWMALCPAHPDRNPSLSISVGRDGRALVYCFAGCSQLDVIAALEGLGLWHRDGYRYDFMDRRTVTPSRADVRSFPNDNLAFAMKIWNAAVKAPGTLVEKYLLSRGLHIQIPETIRFHPRLKHPSGGFWPGMVALVTCGLTGMPCGIHRTFLKRDGSGKAPIEPSKKMLGPCKGGAVRLAEAGQLVMIGEGIETCLTVMQSTKGATWAALSTSGMVTLSLPPSIRTVIVLADGDPPGKTAARRSAERWTLEGRLVQIAPAPWGRDFNDVLNSNLNKGNCA